MWVLFADDDCLGKGTPGCASDGRRRLMGSSSDIRHLPFPMRLSPPLPAFRFLPGCFMWCLAGTGADVHRKDLPAWQAP